ncbi:Hypothetical protein A7982_08090 [Minicystis rosea]|nr:Hypothetical protein A7982_08090 [Minicystis rosea]
MAALRAGSTHEGASLGGAVSLRRRRDLRGEPGTRKRSRLDENLAAATLELTPAELEALEPLAASVLGHRGA